MNATAVIVIAIGAAVLLGALAFMTLARRSDVRGAGALSAETVRRDAAARAAHPDEHEVPTAAEVEAEGAEARTGVALATIDEDTGLTPWVPPDPDALGVSRRQFFNRATISLMAAGLGTFSAASFVAFLWPTKTGGFGGKVPVGRIDDIRSGISAGDGFFYAPEARAWITEYPVDAVPKAEAVYATSLLPGMERGLIASYQKCPHLGCRVPQCVSSQWFECGCHGSQYNRVGEKKAGPAPRGMDHFPLEFSAAGEVTIDTGTIVNGLPIGTNTTGQEAEGPHCVGESDH
ncbi:MAG: Rieske 2Fe-2S domain-containing protein [Ilumatobacter sp.]|uniref:QcrA and Rieske domain-containing protein n=1 Tax=Ilumatobacter sp. TaxID=1967498 RepID=UPI00261B7670|nr:Rieske 2Fe-2S domain-containing protein [Ilumatobacter sp.]MDJ0768525.1 Rieske 2Fe-2S domain-containing protein [Ilumatobacter sp.]